MALRTGHLDEIERKIYSRNILIPEVGEAGQVKLLDSRVLVVGLGGLGSPALYYLAASGIGKIGIADHDRVDLSNLQRQILHGRRDVGRQKTQSAAESIARLRTDIRLDIHPFKITSENARDIIAGYDFVVEATDSFESKFLVNDACVELRKPYSHAGVLGTFGQTMTVVPGEGPCFRCVFGEAPAGGVVESTAEAGVLGCVAGVLGSLQAAGAIKYLLSYGRLLTFDALAVTFREIHLPPAGRCGICGPQCRLDPGHGRPGRHEVEKSFPDNERSTPER